jgi:hypothetical protein
MEDKGSAPVESASVEFKHIWALLLGAGLASGIVSWLVGEVAYDAFAPATERRRIMAGEQQIATPAARMVAATKNAALAFGLFGAVFAAAMGMAGGLAQPVPRFSKLPVLTSVALGGLAGAVAAGMLTTLFFRIHDPVEDRLIVPLLFHCAAGAAVGAVGGLAFGRGLGDRDSVARASLGGSLGAALGAAVYVVAGAIAFPLDKTALPLAAAASPRLLARLVPATLGAAGAAAGVIWDPVSRTR